MQRRFFWFLAVFWAWRLCAAAPQPNDVALDQKPWLEVRTAHFNLYSCGAPRDVYKLSGRLEQFCQAYAQLAGAEALASPPIVVMAFPDHETMVPFLPLYQGRPANLAALFQRGSDENLIVLSLPGSNSVHAGMEVIFHEYTHLLFRHNDRFWPLWLKEGMAEVYSTFETTGPNARIGKPIDHYLRILAQKPMLPLADLFAVDPDSPQYNERNRQGIFYAESWLLTQFLMAGDNPAYKARFGQFQELLRQGQLPEPAFTNALRAPLPAVEAELRRYLQQGRFNPVELTLKADVSAPVTLNTRPLLPVEVYFRLGDELLRVQRPDAAEAYFQQAQKLAPASPLPCEGLGLLAAEREQYDDALRYLSEALRLGSTSFLAHYVYAREKFRQAGGSGERAGPVNAAAAAEIRGELRKSLALMPDFGPAHELLGFFEMVQGENLAGAEQHLQRAIQLEPEKPSYLFTLAQVQLRRRDFEAARRTLQPLLLPNVNVALRAHAREMLQDMAKGRPGD